MVHARGDAFFDPDRDNPLILIGARAANLLGRAHCRGMAEKRKSTLPRRAGNIQQDDADGVLMTAEGKWCPGADLNHRHADFQSAALPTELPGRRRSATAYIAAVIHPVQHV